MQYRVNPLIQHEKNNSFINSILNARGINNIEEYLNANKNDLINYNQLDNIEKAVSIILLGIKTKKKFFLQVDSDNDGFTSSAILYNYLKRIDPNINIKYRLHKGKQHGVIVESVPDDIDIVLIPDAGSNQYEEHKQLFDRGIEVLVIDHHDTDKYSEHATVVNNQLSKNYSNKSLSGAGMVFKLCQALDDKLSVNYANDYLDLTAVGIVGDMMELKELETRYIVSEGLIQIKNFGLKTICKTLSFSIGDILTPTAIAFYITPLINAIIRVGTEDEKEALFLAFIDGEKEVPSTKRGAKTGDIEIAAEKASRVGTNAKNRQKKIVDESIKLIDFRIKKEELDLNKILFIALEEHEAKLLDSNLTGLVANKLANLYKRPTIIVRLAEENIYKGSARVDSNSPLVNFKTFVSNSNLFTFAEGHEGAFGLGIKEKNIDKFIDFCSDELKDIELSNSTYLVDFVFQENNLEELKRFIFEIDPMQTIWGKGVEEPVIILDKIPFNETSITIMGKNQDTTKIQVNGISMMKFKDSNFAEEILKYAFGTITLIGRTQINEWNGNLTPQIIIQDFVLAQDTTF